MMLHPGKLYRKTNRPPKTRTDSLFSLYPKAERLEMMAKVHELGSMFSDTTSVEFLTLH